MPKDKKQYLVPQIMEQLDKADDLDTIIRNENILACVIASPVLFLLSIMNFVIRYVILKQSLENVLLDTILGIMLGAAFEVVLRTKMELMLFVKLVASIYGLWCVFIFVRISQFLGPLVWFGAMLLLVMSMFQVKKYMLGAVGSVIAFMGIYSFLKHPIEVFYVHKIHYGFLLGAISLILLVAVIVHKNNVRRYHRLMKHIHILQVQKNEIESLYEEVMANEEELTEQNEKLMEYNRMMKKNEEKLHFLAYHDGLTELPNRKMIYQRLDELLNASDKKFQRIYVVYIDIDYFKNINDTLGHDAGDEFINAVASRIKSEIHKMDLIGRMGGDEFALIIPRDINEDELYRYLLQIKDKFEENFSIQERIITSSASLGIAIYPKDGVKAVTLLKNADIAMYKSKKLGKNTIQFYHPKFHEEMLQRYHEEYL